MANPTNKQIFIAEVEQFPLSATAREYLENVLKAKKVNKKEQEKSAILKTAILDFLTENSSSAFDRVEIGDALYNDVDLDENLLLNDKDKIAYNSITAFANQLVADGKISKFEVKVGKSKKVKYQA